MAKLFISGISETANHSSYDMIVLWSIKRIHCILIRILQNPDSVFNCIWPMIYNADEPILSRTAIFNIRNPFYCIYFTIGRGKDAVPLGRHMKAADKNLALISNTFNNCLFRYAPYSRSKITSSPQMMLSGPIK